MPPLDIVLPIQVKRIEKSAVLETGLNHDTSHAAGYAAGYEEGRLRVEWEAARLKAESAKATKAMLQKLERIHHEFETLLAEHVPDLIQGALHRVFRNHPFTAEEIGAEVTALVREMEQASRISVECCRVDAEGVADFLQIAQVVPDGMKWSLEANETLVRGEFLLKSDLGDVDGRHLSRIRQIHFALEGSS